MAELDKTFRPAELQAEFYAAWERSGAFAAHPDSPRRPYCIMMPPPNVTGSLHMGHALTFTLQDILIRYHRMQGRDALWQPGTDHAGIATQMVVERQLESQGLNRHELGREAFIERVWEWKAESGGTITRQLRSLGASPDWSRERFTMDEGLSAAVRKVFVALHREGLIYRDKRLVNWDPKLHTAISDLEVESREIKGSLWYFNYPIEGRPGEFITVATTRPETMLGDTGVAVHPEDERYRDLVGQHAVLPLVGRHIPIVADAYADPTTGSGAVKITPAHDFNDFEVGRRHDLPLVNIFDRDAKLNDAAPEAYRGLDRFEARKRIVADLEALGLVAKIEDHTLMVPYGDRSGVVIEPWLTDQWYCDAKTLARAAIEAVESGRTQFVPRQWENTFFEWMRNIQPWCISRQIWWGHQIPAWYAPDGRVFVEETEAEAQAAAKRHYGHEIVLKRDGDVLDTWFSSALWPFSTLGWPERDARARALLPDRRAGHRLRHHLLLGRADDDDGLQVHGRRAVPHRLHPRAGARRARPEDVEVEGQHRRSARAHRALWLRRAALHPGGAGGAGPRHQARGEPHRGLSQFRDQAVERGALCRDERLRARSGFRSGRRDAHGQPLDRGVGRVAAPARVAAAIEDFKFNDAADALYHFTWDTFCDWYVEFTKPILTGSDEAAKAETRAMTAWVLGELVPSAPSDHALHHRGAVATSRRARGRHADRRGMARPRRGSRRRRGDGGDGMGGRAHLGDPHRARRDERAGGGRACRLCHRGERRWPGVDRTPRRADPAPRAAVALRGREIAAQGRAASRGGRRDRAARSRRRSRSRQGARAARARGGRACAASSTKSRRNSPTRNSSPRPSPR